MDKFCIRVFFSQSLREFVDLITFGNINKIKQVYMTMDKRANLVESMMPVSIQKEFNENPLKAFGTYWHLEHSVMRDLYKTMKSRADDYITYVDKCNQIEDREERHAR
ncbi:hypothetical protein TI39_contig4148g00002 [Zymoseptoria brevis]|uniref:Uncharacterized protein n=1 Tax=Zymoseptoria brevis TaxID=1047168 RepID=A0A0F4GFL3_9PEZI|nr:hypothetical protein TI39_contig4148g00002 [Zymoseptoria brevis]